MLLLEGKNDRTLWLWANGTGIRIRVGKDRVDGHETVVSKFVQCANFRFGSRR